MNPVSRRSGKPRSSSRSLKLKSASPLSKADMRAASLFRAFLHLALLSLWRRSMKINAGGCFQRPAGSA